MGLYHGLQPASSGLILLMDADNPKTTSGTSAPNLANGTNAGNVGTPSLVTSGNFKYFQYNGTDQAHRNEVVMGYEFTVVTLLRNSGVEWNDYSAPGSNRKANGYIMHADPNTTSISYYVIGSGNQTYTYVGGSGNLSTLNNWHLYTFTSNGSNVHRAYFDTTRVLNSSTALSTARNNPNTTVSVDSIAEDSDLVPSRKSACDIAYHAIWDRQFDDQEVYDLYRQLKERYGF
jgi:hypothetical protein